MPDTTHTRTATDCGPDFCDECSRVDREWVQWPCPAVRPSDIYDPSEQRWVCLACDMEHPPGPCPFETISAANEPDDNAQAGERDA